MKKLIVLAMTVLASSAAKADGFKCLTAEGDLAVQVYNHLSPDMGTRNAAIMIVSDPMVQEGRQTVAKFTAGNATLDQEGATYTARVDLRFKESRNKGEYLTGTRLGYVKTLELDVDFSYAKPVKAGTLLPAMLTVVKRDGEVIERNMVCSRHLKN